MNKFFTRLLEKIRTNGCAYTNQHSLISHIVYTNMIWMASYISFCLYTIVNFFCIEFNSGFIAITIFFHCCYIFAFRLIRDGYTTIGKHFVLLSAYGAIAVYDHLNGPGVFTYLFLFAFLPASLNIFSFKKNYIVICSYLIFPILYLYLAQIFTYSFFSAPVFHLKNPVFLKYFILFNSYLMFILFAAYMILKSGLKQKNLIAKSTGLQVTLNNASGAIWSIDNQYNLTVTNKQYIDSIESEFGVMGLLPGKNIMKSGLWDKLTPDLQNQYKLVLGGTEFLQEISINDRQYEIKGVPIFDKNGQIIGATFGSRDITKKKQYEQVLINAKKMTDEASKSKERFLSNMSHEIRTPLNGIIGIVDILKDEACLPEQQEHLKNLKNLSQHTLELVTNILDFAKIESGKSSLDTKRFSLRQFLHKVKSIFHQQTKLRGIDFKLSIVGEHDIFIEGDEVRLSQVLINLIGNAIKFTEKGQVELCVKITPVKEESFYQLQFQVIDTGIGIHPDNVKKIFESFTQAEINTTRKYGGTGLGLTISEKILQLMNSRLVVESEWNKGSTFYFTIELPKSSYIPPLRLADAKTMEKNFLPNVNVLLAEDNKINQLVANKILLKWKTNVTIVDDGKKAFEQVQLHQYDIILMDLDMPVMDGYESMDLIKNINPSVPVIALTAASFDDMENNLKKRGFSQVVQKPFVKEDLYQKISALLK